jgi:4-amino-4-deoxy-L-arabinose transferase-like glycosyltransferase
MISKYLTLKWEWCISLFIKLWIVGLIPLLPDEAYYWVWSKRPQLSYFDHPPFAAWLFYLGSFLPKFAVRWPAILLVHIGLIFWLDILKTNGFNTKQIRLWFHLSHITIFIGIAGLFVTPDLPLLFFWVISIWFYCKALNSPNIIWNVLFGVSLGLGFCSKYHIVILPIALFIHLTLTQQWNRLTLKGVFATILFGLVGMFPVFIWNLENNWASFRFQIQHGLGANQWNYTWTLEYILGVSLLVFPVFFTDLKKTLIVNRKFKLENNSLVLFWILGLTPILFFLLTTFKGKVELNWPGPAYIAITSIIAWTLPKMWKVKTYIITWSLMIFIVFSHWISGWWSSAPMKVNEPREVYLWIDDVLQYSPLYFGSYQWASSTWFETGTPFFKLKGMRRFDYFDSFKESIPDSKSFYLVHDNIDEYPDWLIKRAPTFKTIKSYTDRYELVKIDLAK